MGSNSKTGARGFTLIEILVVIGIIAILAAIVIVAINPAKQFAQARNTDRQSAVNSILNAIGQRMADNKGTFAGTFTVGGTTYYCGALPTTGTSTVNTTALDASAVLATETGNLGCLVPTYISALPLDPAGPTAPGTGYTLKVQQNGRVMVCAPNGNEPTIPNSDAICVTR